jgi:tetratricopeptide (TPR) repeat protein
MANKVRNKPGTERIETTENNPLVTLQARYEKNKKNINTAITVVLALVVGFFAYQKLYKEPREEKAGTSVAFAQRYFEADSLNLALNGDGQHQGFLKIIKKYSGTSAENICHYYAGVCYLRMGDFKNAIKHFEDFDGHGTVLALAAWGSLGDAYMETKNTKKGIEYYEKASGDKDNNVYTPLYLYRLGIAYEMANKPEDAKKAYQRIKDDYPQSEQARDMDKYLARLGELN